MIAWIPSAITQSPFGISAILARTSRSASSRLAVALSSRARSRIAARSSAVNLEAIAAFLAGRGRKRLLRARRQPFAQLRVDRRVVEQREVRGRCDVEAVLLAEGEPALAAASRAAGHEHERVAEQAPERVALAAGDRRRDEAVRRTVEERDLLTGGRTQRVRVAAVPVL